PTHFVDIGLNLAHALPNPPAIGLQFFLTGAANADAPRSASSPTRATAAALSAQPRHGSALPGQARQQVIQLRQFHLQLALAASRNWKTVPTTSAPALRASSTNSERFSRPCSPAGMPGKRGARFQPTPTSRARSAVETWCCVFVTEAGRESQ